MEHKLTPFALTQIEIIGIMLFVWALGAAHLYHGQDEPDGLPTSRKRVHNEEEEMAMAALVPPRQAQGNIEMSMGKKKHGGHKERGYTRRSTSSHKRASHKRASHKSHSRHKSRSDSGSGSDSDDHKSHKGKHKRSHHH